jgi:TolB-like protein/Tfp pilus assembly protein PilF
LSPLEHLLKESHRRSIWQVLAIYLAGCWVALEVVQGIVDAGNLPDWLPGLALVLLIIGFPIVLTTAFIQSSNSAEDRTGGEAEEHFGNAPGTGEDADASRGSAQPPAANGTAQRLFTWKNAILGGMGAFALWGVVAAFLMATGRAGGFATESPEETRASIAVLPFTSTRTDEESESFTLGIHDDILTQLSKVGSFRVVSRTSVMEYRESTKNLREIGQELGVSTVLEGSIQRSGDRIHLNAQLIDAGTDEHLWADSYDRTLTVENVFHIQRELAEAIAGQLHATLTPDEAASIDAPPTESLEAYDYYLQGNVYFSRGPRSDDFRIAVEMYEKAVELDPGFALAHARLALTHGFLFQLQGRRPEELEASKEAVDRALELAPELPEGHLALGEYYYWGPRDFVRAMAEYGRARAAGLNTYDLYHALGAVQRRLGDFEGSIESFREAIRLDPRSAHIWEDLGSTYRSMGRFAEAEEALTRAVAMAPEEGGSYWWLVNTVLARDGSTTRARELVERGREGVDDGLSGQLRFLDGLDGNWQAVLDAIEDPRPWNRWARAEALTFLGRDAEARVLYDSVRVAGAEFVREHPNAVDTDLELAIAHAALGDAEAAQAEIGRVVALVEGDALDRPSTTFSEIFVHTRLGDHDQAFEALDRLFQGLPHDYPPRYVALFPHLTPLQEDARWAQMMERYRQPAE